MNLKRKGTMRERKTIWRLEVDGYYCTRAAGSLGVWDIVAVGPTDMKLIQVKANSWPGSREMKKLKNFKCPDNCSKEVWRWDDYSRQPELRVL